VFDRPQYSIWLLPRADHEVALSATIVRLSTELDGAWFAPHVTIQGDVALSPEQLRPRRLHDRHAEAAKWNIGGDRTR